MNYKESAAILKEVKKAKNILIACHRGPDMDSVGSALAMAGTIKKMGKNVVVVCTSKIIDDLKFLDGAKEIIEQVNFGRFDYSKYDLFIIPDASSWQMITDNPEAQMPKMKIIAIDHHKTNEKFGYINLVEPKVTSVGELLYFVFKDWKIAIDKNVATSLLTGILGDTGVFMYPGSGNSTFKITQELISKGADKDEIVLRTYRTRSFKIFKFLGEILDRMEIDTKNKFVWSAVPFEIYEKYDKPENGKEVAASMVMQSVEGTDFGFVMVEIDRNHFSISFRSRTGFDVSPLAERLGGGGHAAAAGARIRATSFDGAVLKVLEVARKYAKGSKKV